jgi:predicted nucleic acid-binding Zn ribbon protein
VSLPTPLIHDFPLNIENQFIAGAVKVMDYRSENQRIIKQHEKEQRIKEQRQKQNDKRLNILILRVSQLEAESS